MAGWEVGKSDFNENPVVSLDLDFDFGLRLRVCQNMYHLMSKKCPDFYENPVLSAQTLTWTLDFDLGFVKTI